MYNDTHTMITVLWYLLLRHYHSFRFKIWRSNLNLFLDAFSIEKLYFTLIIYKNSLENLQPICMKYFYKLRITNITKYKFREPYTYILLYQLLLYVVYLTIKGILKSSYHVHVVLLRNKVIYKSKVRIST